ncbi:MAG TPA: hypothetical protein VN651_09425 [Gemmatimonadaceae bacterium]|nr:hypothetical protein [Gemmatimonadaceae bacterium]
MAGAKLDSAGTIRLKTLDDALLLLARVNNIVEQYGLALKRNQPTSSYTMNLRRTLPTLAENLKSQFGLIAEQVLAVNLASSRGASEAMRLRALREGVAQIKQAIEIAITQTKDKYTVKDDADEPKPAE